MPDGTITVSPNGAETIRVKGAFQSTETRDGWRVELLMELPYPDVPPEQLVNEVADLAAGETHYSARSVDTIPWRAGLWLRAEGQPRSDVDLSPIPRAASIHTRRPNDAGHDHAAVE